MDCRRSLRWRGEVTGIEVQEFRRPLERSLSGCGVYALVGDDKWRRRRRDLQNDHVVIRDMLICRRSLSAAH